MNYSTIQRTVFSLAFATLFLVGFGCNSLTKTEKGASIGAGAGGVIGAFIGKSAGNTALGAIIGGAIGGTAGVFIGKSMDKQAAELKQSVPGATVIRQGEGIVVKFDSGILFDTDKSDLKPEAQTNLTNLATSLQNNPETDILIVGHTDSLGTPDHNMALSLARANAVKAFIVAANVNAQRLGVAGKAATEPVATNSTPEGRAKNRRVEVIITANAAMKKRAQKAQ